MTQHSLFGAAASEPTLVDLDGVVLGGGLWVRQGDTARLSVVVAERWRADALAAEFALRDVGTPDAVVRAVGGYGARSAFSANLAGSATRWSLGARQGPPPAFILSPGGLRLWAIVSGRSDPAGYLLGTARPDDAVHLACGAQLSRLGLGAVSIPARGGPGWRVTSAKRIRRLAELLGDPPADAGTDWPLAYA
jgi:hypothetical protein